MPERRRSQIARGTHQTWNTASGKSHPDSEVWSPSPFGRKDQNFARPEVHDRSHRGGYICFGDNAFSESTKGLPAAGTGTSPRMISTASTVLPYSSWSAVLSAPMSAVPNDAPANSPFVCE